MFDAEFTDGPVGAPTGVPASVVDELCGRTLGYTCWQQDRWLYHCGDGCAFLGAVGRAELDAHPDALQSSAESMTAWGSEEGDVNAYIDSLSRTGSPTAYLFASIRCGARLAFSDFD